MRFSSYSEPNCLIFWRWRCFILFQDMGILLYVKSSMCKKHWVQEHNYLVGANNNLHKENSLQKIPKSTLLAWIILVPCTESFNMPFSEGRTEIKFWSHSYLHSQLRNFYFEFRFPCTALLNFQCLAKSLFGLFWNIVNLSHFQLTVNLFMQRFRKITINF